MDEVEVEGRADQERWNRDRPTKRILQIIVDSG